MTTMHEQYIETRVNAFMRAYKGCRDLMMMLSETAPNARDFASDVTFNIARDVYRARVSAIDAIAREITADAMLIQKTKPYPKG